MDYEKKYNEAMLRADEAVQKGCLDKDMFDIIFPPEESEDERMIRKIKSFLSAYDAYYFRNDEWREIEVWLEKQKINTEGDFGRGYDCGYQAGYAVAVNKMKPKVATTTLATLDSENQKEQKSKTILG